MWSRESSPILFILNQWEWGKFKRKPRGEKYSKRKRAPERFERFRMAEKNEQMPRFSIWLKLKELRKVKGSYLRSKEALDKLEQFIKAAPSFWMPSHLIWFHLRSWGSLNQGKREEYLRERSRVERYLKKERLNDSWLSPSSLMLLNLIPNERKRPSNPMVCTRKGIREEQREVPDWRTRESEDLEENEQFVWLCLMETSFFPQISWWIAWKFMDWRILGFQRKALEFPECSQVFR